MSFLKKEKIQLSFFNSLYISLFSASILAFLTLEFLNTQHASSSLKNKNFNLPFGSIFLSHLYIYIYIYIEYAAFTQQVQSLLKI
jgi:hypothetical protein